MSTTKIEQEKFCGSVLPDRSEGARRVLSESSPDISTSESEMTFSRFGYIIFSSRLTFPAKLFRCLGYYSCTTAKEELIGICILLAVDARLSLFLLTELCCEVWAVLWWIIQNLWYYILYCHMPSVYAICFVKLRHLKIVSIFLFVPYGSCSLRIFLLDFFNNTKL